MRESKLQKTEVEMVRLISLHRIFPLQDAKTDDIDEVDEIDTHDRHCCRDFPPCDDRECRDEECKYDRPGVSHDTESLDIESGD